MSNFADKHYPEQLAPEDLDDYLARGWYRMGQTIFTTHFLCFGDHFYSSIWVRLPLLNHELTKRQRKLMRRNAELFHTEVRPASITREKERLFQRYKNNFPGTLAPSLRNSLLDGEDYNIYTTFEVAITERRTHKLVGLSFFDIGENSAASISGIYDPDYQKYSLGFYTMLLEMEYCMQQRMHYYYPGYVVPGYPRFDYKLRIGECEYLNLTTGRWEPFRDLPVENIPIERMRRQLADLHQRLQRQGIPARLLYYPLFEAPLFGFWNAPYLDYPVLIQLETNPRENHFYLIVYNVRVAAFQLLRCSPFDDLQFYFNENYTNSFDRSVFFMELVIVDHVLEQQARAEDMVEALGALYPWLT